VVRIATLVGHNMSVDHKNVEVVVPRIVEALGGIGTNLPVQVGTASYNANT
jgi:hypothetical protein